MAATGGVNTGGTTTGSGGSTGGIQAGGTTSSGGAKSGGSTTAEGGSAVVTGGSASGGAGGSTGGSGGKPATATGDLWVSPTGQDSNPGTKESPLKSLQKAAIMAVPGTTIWMMEGTHSYDARVAIKSTSVDTPLLTDAVNPIPELVQNGTADKPIKIWAVEGTRPVIDFKPLSDKAGTDKMIVQRARGILFWAMYWHIRGLEIKNAPDNCVHVAGSYNTFENLSIHDCGDTGLQITVPEALGSDLTLGAHNKVINCDSYLNFDVVTNGENADGFAAKDRVGPGNEFRGCRSYRNTDDGWDFFYSNSPVVLENCWAFDMKHPKATGSSDGNGFKLGGQRSGEPTNKADHKLSKCFSFNNPAVGFDRNNNTGTITCTGCGAWGNKTNFEAGIVHTGDVTLSVTPEQAIAAKRNADGSLPDISTLK